MFFLNWPQQLQIVPVRMCEVSPLQLAGRGNQTSAGRGAGQLPSLPPLSVRLVHHLQQVSSAERHPCVRTGDGAVLQGAVVHHRLHIHLTDKDQGNAAKKLFTFYFTTFIWYFSYFSDEDLTNKTWSVPKIRFCVFTTQKYIKHSNVAPPQPSVTLKYCLLDYMDKDMQEIKGCGITIIFTGQCSDALKAALRSEFHSECISKM